MSYTTSIRWQVGAGILPSGGELVLGLVSAVATGTGFSAMKLTVSGVNGSGISFTASFTTVAQANNYFDDNLVKVVALSGSPALNVTVTLTETLPGNTSSLPGGYEIDFMLGVTPATAGAAAAARRRRIG